MHSNISTPLFTAASQANETDATAHLMSAGPTKDATAWVEELRYTKLGITLWRSWTLDGNRSELVCAVRVIATSPATPVGNPTLLEGWLGAAVHATPDAENMTARYFSPHPQAEFDINCCPGCPIEGGTHVAGEVTGLASTIYAPLHTAAAGYYDRSNQIGAASWLSASGGQSNWSSWTTASEGNFNLAAAMQTYSPKVCAGQWEHFVFRGFTSDTAAMNGGFEFRMTIFDGEPLSFLRAAAELPARMAVMETRTHNDPASSLPDGNALIMFPYYAPGATGSAQDLSEQLLAQLQRVATASNAKVV
jgi:hypothetical protein